MFLVKGTAAEGLTNLPTMVDQSPARKSGEPQNEPISPYVQWVWLAAAQDLLCKFDRYISCCRWDAIASESGT